MEVALYVWIHLTHQQKFLFKNSPAETKFRIFFVQKLDLGLMMFCNLFWFGQKYLNVESLKNNQDAN